MTETGFLGGCVDWHGGVTASVGTCLAAGSYLWVSWKWIWAKGREERLEFQVLRVEAEGSRSQFCFGGSVLWTSLSSAGSG